tara:strand:- start:277 stop:690 length:414 start_codon:yes stop_codon:yes gene_type:complete
MAALTKDRNTHHKFKQRKIYLDVAATTTIYNGSLVAVNAAGYAVPASDASGLIVQGRAEEQVVNSGSAGDKSIEVSTGVFKLATSGGSAAVQADVGDNVFVLDDQTVVKTGGTTNTIVAGVMEELADDGDVWVRVNL